MNADRRLVLIESKSQLYSFYARGRFVAQYQSSGPLDAEDVESLRTDHPIPKERA